jgi:hypothetical protein
LVESWIDNHNRASQRAHRPTLQAKVKEVLTRLPAMTNQDDIAALTPSKWKPPPADKAAESKSR